ncbi:MAG: hypothetical protein COW63_10190 [Bacteroidetes bacterium CG18_big_fil_WC_8_21_14_2_50_41_14]|nr:MAG: hypothetical protein COW63_10190 [Bacteroidetes bacterium CG18_big_fil_WC_8_21_14_2_50_41_14]PJB59547.1 MAG: hypothetical protein CO098_02795 [Bacteroidetes bacterium CG_4_9_14_3_um_filter_41_19]
MKPTINPPNDLHKIRNKAEEIVKKLSSTKNALRSWMPEADALKLIHELQVHQIELELQNEELVLANEQIEKLNSEKDRLISVIVNDIESSFNSVVGYSELLVKQARDNDLEGLEKYAGLVHQSSLKAMKLIKNLTDRDFGELKP